VYAVLKDRKNEPDTKYFAVYISPIAIYEKESGKKRVYYRMKEMFLHTGYYSQVIYKNKIINYDKYSNQVKANEYFNIYLPNIEAAMLAKLGGIPWRLERDDDGRVNYRCRCI
jgi:hypothetical protein